MLKRLSALAIFALVAGCAGDSYRPNAVISDIEPNSIASGRTKDVEIHGNATKWKVSTIEVGDIDFGEGITVDAVTVANEGFLVVTITAAASATLGPRDVEVDGEDLRGAFFVNPPFEVLNQTIIQGDYALLDIVGYDTDWLDGRTELTTADADVYVDGDDLFGIGSTTVLAPNFVQALIQIDPFAPPGPRSLAISGLTTNDSRPDALTVEAAEFGTLAAGNNPLSMENAGYRSAKLKVPAGEALTIQDLAISAGTGEPIALVFDEDLGTAEVIAFFGDSFVFSTDDTFTKYNFAPGKELTILVWDANWIDDAYFGDVETTGDALGADLFYATETPEAITGTPLTGEQLTANGDERWFHFAAADPWNLVSVLVTTSQGGSTLDGVVRGVHEGGAGLTTVDEADGSGSGGNETLVTLAGRDLDLFIGVRDYFDNKNGAASEFEISFTEMPIAGTFYESAGQDLEIPEEGQISSTLTVAASGLTVLTGIHVALDIDHTYRGDLLLELESPGGTTVTIFDGFYTSDEPGDGLVEVFPDSSTEEGDLTDFFLDASWDGTWTLHVTDTLAPDAGLLRGWGISLEGT